MTMDTLMTKHGETDHKEVVKSWNDGAAKGDRVVGAKASGLSNVLSLSKRNRSALLGTVSKFGYESTLFYSLGV